MGRTLHFFGGSDASRVDSALHWGLSLDGGTTWGTFAPLAVTRNHLGGAVVGNKLYAIGGQTGQDAAAVQRFAVDI